MKTEVTISATPTKAQTFPGLFKSRATNAIWLGNKPPGASTIVGVCLSAGTVRYPWQVGQLEQFSQDAWSEHCDQISGDVTVIFKT